MAGCRTILLQLPGLALEAVFIDQTEGAEAFYDGLLDQYLDPGELVIWLGEKMLEETQAAFRRFLERGGRLFMASRELSSSSQIGPFLQDVLHLSQNADTRITSVHGATGSAVQGQDFLVEHSSLSTCCRQPSRYGKTKRDG